MGTVDYKVPHGFTLNSKYELGPEKYTVGATWDGTISNKGTTLKLWYSNKDNLVSGDATLNVAKVTEQPAAGSHHLHHCVTSM